MTAATPNATLVSSTSPSGTIPTTPATVPRSAESRSESLSWLHEQQRGRRDERPGDDTQDQVDSVHQLRTRELEPASLGGDLACVRVGTDMRGLEPTAARHDEAAGVDLVAGVLVDRVTLPGEQRFVDLEANRESHDTITRDLVAGAQIEQVVDDDLLDRYLLDVAVADNASARRVQHREPVERALGAYFLDDADRRVREEHEPERRVLDRARPPR